MTLTPLARKGIQTLRIQAKFPLGGFVERSRLHPVQMRATTRKQVVHCSMQLDLLLPFPIDRPKKDRFDIEDLQRKINDLESRVSTLEKQQESE